MFKVNNTDTRTKPFGVVLVSLLFNFEHISHFVPVFLLLTLNYVIASSILTWKNMWSAAAYSPEVGPSTLVEVAANTNNSS